MASQRKRRAQNKYYSNNAKELKAKAKASYRANPEKKKAASKASYSADPQTKKTASKAIYRSNLMHCSVS